MDTVWCVFFLIKYVVGSRVYVLKATCATLAATKKAFALLSPEDRANAYGKTPANQDVITTMQGYLEAEPKNLVAWAEYDIPNADIQYQLLDLDKEALEGMQLGAIL
mgnify:CR=1 FL=1